MKFSKSNSLILSFLLVFISISLSTSCMDNGEKDTFNIIKKEKISGYVQKGPFVNGTTVQMNELNENLIQSGKVFSSQILDNSGNFEIKSVELSSSFVEFTASGFYFNEVEGKLSSSQIALSAISDIKDISTINVNLLTHLEKRRVEFLVSEGKTFVEAKKKAQEEVLGIFSFTLSGNSISESLDISKNSDGNAMLLAISVILQGQRTEGPLSELLAIISSDIEKDGLLNNQQLLTELRESAVGLDMEAIRKNLISRFNTLGIQAAISPFETYVNQFLSFTAKEPVLGEISVVEKTSNLASFRILVNPNSAASTVKIFYGESKESIGSSVNLTASPIKGNIPVEVSGQI